MKAPSPRPFSPLEGYRILDLSRLYPGPMCTLVLAHLGAEVVKVEEPEGGDYMRWFPPLVGGMGVAFAALNRGKKSVTLDLRKKPDLETFLGLAGRFDAVVEGFRPGVLARLGAGYDELVARNPRMVLLSITGYGQTGPRSGDAGHDDNFLALTGLLNTTGLRGGRVVLPGFQAVDVLTGFYAALAVAAALPEARGTGKPRWLDLSMAESALTLAMLDFAQSGAGVEPGRGENLLNGGAPVYNVYETSDGGHMAVGALEEKFHARLIETLGLPAGLKEDAFSPGSGLERAVSGAFKEKTRDEWARIFGEKDACVTPVLTTSEAAALDQFESRGAVDRRTVPGIPMVLPPLFETGAAPRALGPAPALGEHNDEILGAHGHGKVTPTP